MNQRTTTAVALAPILCLDCDTYVPAGWIDFTDAPKCPTTGTSHRVLTSALQSILDTAANAARLPRHMRPSAVHADRAQALLAQAMDYSAAADKARHDEPLEARYTEGLQATIKALGILQGISEADAHEMFMEALDA